jgi:hypothetical protein
VFSIGPNGTQRRAVAPEGDGPTVGEAMGDPTGVVPVAVGADGEPG